jgi:molecular chaperone DnaK
VAEVIVGIDLGTSNCVVAHCDATGEVQTLADEAGYKIHPSVVSFLPSGGVVVGAEAKQRKVIDPQNTIYSAKRLIGRSFRSPEVQASKGRMPYQIREGANQLPLISTRAGEFAIPEISAVLLDYVRNIAARALNTDVNQAVITVPANFNDAQRTATATAGAIAGITVVRVLNEPTAAALAYGHSRALKQTIAVYDFGGGTFDITILRLDDQVYEVLGTAGDSFLGGDDLDERLVDRMVERFLAEQRIDLRNNEVAMMRLRAVAEQTKIELSRRNRAVVRIDEIAYGARGAPLNLQIEITREEFVAMVSDIILRTFPVCQESLKLAGLGVDGIDDIVLVGGTTKIPAVRDQVAKFFSRPPRNDINPEEAVAIGASLQADSLQRILARSARPSAVSATSQTTPGAMALDDGEATSQSPMPEVPTAVGAGPSGHGQASGAGAAGRPKRETADIASAGMRPFSERPGERGRAVDRYQSKDKDTSSGMAVGRVESGRVATSATGTTAVGLISADPADAREQTSTRRSYIEHDEEESTAARLPIQPPLEDTSTGAPMEVPHESTRASHNPVATGRRPAPIGYSSGGASATPPTSMPPPGASAAARRRSVQMAAQAPPSSVPLAPPPPPPGPPASAQQPTMIQPAVQPPPPPAAARRSREQPAAPPPPPSQQLRSTEPTSRAAPRVSQPRIAAPSGVPVRDSLPAIDLLGEEPSSAASTAPGMPFAGDPNDPASTARGLVPNPPTSLAGQSLPGGLAAPPSFPSTTARGVAPAAPTMMIGTGLASAGPAAPQPWPAPSAAPLPPSGPVSSGPMARTMIAQAPDHAVGDERFPPPAPFGGGPGGFVPPGGPGSGQPGYGNGPGPGGYGAPSGHGPGSGQPGYAPDPGLGGYGPPGGQPGYGAGPESFGPGSGQPGYGAGPGSAPAGGYGPPGLGPIPGGGGYPSAPDASPSAPDAFSSLPPAPSGAQLRTPMAFAAPAMRRPGDDDAFFPPPRPPAGHAAPPPYGGMPAASQQPYLAPPPLAAMHAAPPSPVVLDVTPFGLGIVTVAGYCEELVRRNTRVPTEMRRSFSTSRDAQDVVRIAITQGESRRVEENTVIGELVLADLPRKPRGETSIEVTFAIDASGILHVRARDATSGREQRASLNVIGTIPEGDVAASRNRMQQLRPQTNR